MKAPIAFTRVANDRNGNPRYVCDFKEFLKPGENDNIGTVNRDGTVMTPEDIIRYIHGVSRYQYEYAVALKRAKQIGGKKYDTKSYAGGIVFQSYNIHQTEQDILNLLK